MKKIQAQLEQEKKEKEELEAKAAELAMAQSEKDNSPHVLLEVGSFVEPDSSTGISVGNIDNEML